MSFTETKRCCPVCRRAVAPTRGERPVVVRHQDRIGRTCPMSGELYELTEAYRPPVRTWAETA